MANSLFTTGMKRRRIQMKILVSELLLENYSSYSLTASVTLDNELAPDFVNSKYECFRPTPLKPYYNQKLVYLLRLLERQRELDMEDKNALSYRHTIAAIKVCTGKDENGYIFTKMSSRHTPVEYDQPKKLPKLSVIWVIHTLTVASH